MQCTYDIIDLLLQRKDIDINQQDCNGINPLLALMNISIHNKINYSGQEHILEQLFNDPRINLNIIDSKKRSVLSPYYSDFETFSKLIKMNKIDLNQILENGYTPLHYAVMYNSMECFLYLLSTKKINIAMNYIAENGFTFLHLAASVKSSNFFNYFERKGIDINCQDSEGKTPLMILINQPAPIIKLWNSILRRKKLKINLQDKKGVFFLFFLFVNIEQLFIMPQ